MPLIGEIGLTVTTADAVQPRAVYMIVVVPPAIPVTRPVAAPMVATPGVPLLQAPPAVASLNVVVLPTHTVSVPVIGDIGFTVTTAETEHPAPVV